MTHIACKGHYILIVIEWLRYTFTSHIRDVKCLFMLWYVRLGRYESFRIPMGITPLLLNDSKKITLSIRYRYILWNHTFHFELLTPIWNILGTSWSVICGQKIHSHIFISDDVIHRRNFLTSWLSETTRVALFSPHLVWSRDVII